MNFFRKLNRQEKRQEGPRDRRRVLRRKFDLASAALEAHTMLTVAFDLAYGAPGANLYGAAGFHDGGGAVERSHARVRHLLGQLLHSGGYEDFRGYNGL